MRFQKTKTKIICFLFALVGAFALAGCGGGGSDGSDGSVDQESTSVSASESVGSSDSQTGESDTQGSDENNPSSSDSEDEAGDYAAEAEAASDGTATGDGVYTAGGEVTFTAQPYLGYEFYGWFDGKTYLSGEAEYTFVMPDEDICYTAVFAPREDMRLYEFSSSPTECTITGIRADVEEVPRSLNIPDCVTEIGESALESQGIKEVVIPDSVQRIGDCAFYDCSLKKVWLGKGVRSIGSRAFVGEEGVEVHISDLSAWCALELGNQSEGQLHTSYLPFEQGYNMYFGDQPLTDLVVPETVERVGDFTFYGCANLRSVVIPLHVKEIGTGAFAHCAGLERAEIAAELVGNGAFSFCEALSECTLSEGVRELGYGTFSHVDALQSIVIPGSVESLDPAFYNCTGLAEVEFGDGVKHIGDYVFVGCGNLSKVVFPESLVSVGFHTFFRCPIEGELRFGENMRTIGFGAFDGCVKITSLDTGDGVTEIEGIAFRGCDALTDVRLGNNLKKVADDAFDSCNSMKNIHIDSLEMWCGLGGYKAFYRYEKELYLNGERITRLVIPETVKELSTCTFYKFTGIKSVVLHEGLKFSGEAAFGGCNSLESIVLAPNIEWKYSQFYKEFGSDEKPWSLTIWYFGTEAEWVEEYRDDQLYDEATAEVYFYSQTEPPMNEECTAYDGNYWHYASDGVTPVVWVKE